MGVENEQACAGRGGRTRLARPKSQARTGIGKYSFSLSSCPRAGLATLPGRSILVVQFFLFLHDVWPSETWACWSKLLERDLSALLLRTLAVSWWQRSFLDYVEGHLPVARFAFLQIFDPNLLVLSLIHIPHPFCFYVHKLYFHCWCYKYFYACFH